MWAFLVKVWIELLLYQRSAKSLYILQTWNYSPLPEVITLLVHQLIDFSEQSNIVPKSLDAGGLSYSAMMNLKCSIRSQELVSFELQSKWVGPLLLW